MHHADDPVVSPEIKKRKLRVLGKRLPVHLTDNGSEFILKSLDKWAYEHRVYNTCPENQRITRLLNH